jgi:hypothetical protein
MAQRAIRAGSAGRLDPAVARRALGPATNDVLCGSCMRRTPLPDSGEPMGNTSPVRAPLTRASPELLGSMVAENPSTLLGAMNAQFDAEKPVNYPAKRVDPKVGDVSFINKS